MYAFWPRKHLNTSWNKVYDSWPKVLKRIDIVEQFNCVELVDREIHTEEGTNGYVCPTCIYLCPCKCVGIFIFVCMYVYLEA